MAKQKDQNTEKRIKEAAAKIFTEKGLAGARMQDIADAAKVNKAMLHYYFRNKQKLFDLIFEEKLFKLFGAMSVIVFSDSDFEGKIRQFVAAEIDIMSEFPGMPLFVLNELKRNPTMMEEKLKDKPIHLVRQQLQKIIQTEIEAGRMREISVEYFMINLVSLCLFPFIARPMIQFLLDLEDEKFLQVIEERKVLVADMILNDLKVR